MPNLKKADKEFLIKLEQLVQENLGNESFGVSELAKELGMSRSNLHRKVNAITEASVSQYIRQARLEAAKELLQKTTDTVSEVGYKVGFSSTSYFIKCFGDFYGYPPGQVEEEEESTSVPERKEKKKRITLLVSVLSVLILTFAVTFSIIKGFKGDKNKNIDSLAILPIENLTGDDNFDNVAAGMHSVLISDIQERVSGLYVSNKTSSKAFKNREVSLSKIASELDVEAIVEAELMRYGDSIEIQFKLISVYPAEEQRWRVRYKEEKSKLLNLYSRLTKIIVDDLEIELSSEEEKLLTESRVVKQEAIDAYLMGRISLEQFTKESLLKAIEYFNLAIEIDPEWADPYSGLVEAMAFQKQRRLVLPSEAQKNIDKYLPIALKLNPNSAKAHYVSAIIAVWTEWDWEKAEREFLRALELNPSDALCRAYFAHFLMIMKRKDEALAQVNLALKLDPMRPMVLTLCATVLRIFRDYDLALEQLENALFIEPGHPLAKNSLSVIYRQQGDYKKWFDIWKNNTPLTDEEISSIEKILLEEGYIPALKKIVKTFEDMQKEGKRIPEQFIAGRYIELKSFDKAMDYWDMVYEKHAPNMPYLSIYNINNKELNDNARFVELMKKMNLPVTTSN